MDGITTKEFLNLRSFTSFLKGSASQNFVVDICSQEEFHSILVREKARADRNGHGFSLVAIAVPDINDTPPLTEKLQQLIRTTDEIGWFDQNTLGVFLYNTSALGAWKFVNNSSKKAGVGFSISKCSVYSYPNEWCAF